MNEAFERSKTAGIHHQLGRLAGKWKGLTKTWFEPGKLADESPMTGSMRPLLGSKFLLHEYTGSISGRTFEGLTIYGYDLSLGKFQSAWIDSFHTGTAIMFSESDKGTGFNLLGTYAYITTEAEQHWGWRTTIELKSQDELILTAFNVSPEGEEVMATETVYYRVN